MLTGSTQEAAPDTVSGCPAYRSPTVYQSFREACSTSVPAYTEAALLQDSTWSCPCTLRALSQVPGYHLHPAAVRSSTPADSNPCKHNRHGPIHRWPDPLHGRGDPTATTPVAAHRRAAFRLNGNSLLQTQERVVYHTVRRPCTEIPRSEDSHRRFAAVRRQLAETPVCGADIRCSSSTTGRLFCRRAVVYPLISQNTGSHRGNRHTRLWSRTNESARQGRRQCPIVF